MKTEFKVKGMHCKSCEMLIDDDLSELKGVKSSKSDNKSGIVIVEYDESKVTDKEIKKTIEGLGYKVD